MTLLRIVRNVLVFTLMIGLQATYGQSKELPQGHLKKPNPNELYVSFYQEDDCWGSYEQIVTNELAQSRIKRTESWSYDELLLTVNISCLPLGNNLSVVNYIQVEFGRYTFPVDWQPDEYSFLRFTYDYNYGGIVSTSKDSE